MTSLPSKFFQSLLRLVEAIAQPHDRASIAHLRESFTAALLSSMPDRCQSIAFLWLLDECNSQHVATLWAVKASFDQTVDRHAIEPCRLTLVDSYWKNAGSFANQEQIQEQFQISLKNEELRLQLKKSHPTIALDTFRSEFLLPLCVGGPLPAIEPIGFLHLISSCETVFPDFTDSEISIFTRLLSNATAVRVTSGRRQRISYATTKFNEGLQSANTTKLLAKTAAQVLLNQARAVSCAIYRRNDDLGLKLWIDENNELPSPGALTIDSMSYKVFRASGGPVRRFLSLKTEHLPTSFQVSSSLADELPPGHGAASTSWLSYVVKSPNFRKELDPVPLFLIRLLTISQPSHIGGSFNATDQEILVQLGDYLTALLPDALLREALEHVSSVSGEIQHKIRERLAKVNFFGREREFAKVIKQTVSAVHDVQIAQRTIQDGIVQTAFWNTEGTPVKSTTAFDWQSRQAEQIPETAKSFKRPIVRKNILDIPVYNIDKRAIGLRCCLRYGELAAHEWNIIEYIVAELRFAALGSLDTHEKTYQIAEIRHALNAGLTGLLGHLKSTNEIYSDSTQAYRDGYVQIAHRRIFEEAQFRKSLERARISGEQISAFFEDTRVLLADITKESLQRSLIDIGSLLTELSTLFLRETARRKIQITTKGVQTRTFVTYDRTLLKLALFNLLDNAVKYSFVDNIVTIFVSTESFRPNLSIGIQNVGAHIPLSVRDEIFEPFTRIRHAGIQAMPGTGLGLAASRKIAQVHGGDIKVDSVPIETRQDATIRARTTFNLIIPRE
jgi:signal transduction histidine kinase